MRILVIALLILAASAGAVFGGRPAADAVKMPPPMQAVYHLDRLLSRRERGRRLVERQLRIQHRRLPVVRERRQPHGRRDRRRPGRLQLAERVVGVRRRGRLPVQRHEGRHQRAMPGRHLCAASFDQNMPWFGTARGRLGYASAGWLIYATGGYAYTRLESNASASAGRPLGQRPARRKPERLDRRRRHRSGVHAKLERQGRVSLHGFRQSRQQLDVHRPADHHRQHAAAHRTSCAAA